MKENQKRTRWVESQGHRRRSWTNPGRVQALRITTDQEERGGDLSAFVCGGACEYKWVTASPGAISTCCGPGPTGNKADTTDSSASCSSQRSLGHHPPMAPCVLKTHTDTAGSPCLQKPIEVPGKIKQVPPGICGVCPARFTSCCTGPTPFV